MSSNLVSLDWLSDHLNDPNVRIVDCRFILGNPDIGRESYLQDHIPNAFYLDLEKDLSGPKQNHGGRHPLPDPTELAEKLSGIGIDETIQVIAYDDQGGAMAARLWWLLEYLGHAKVSLLDGNYATWKQQGYPISNQLPAVEPRVFKPNVQTDRIATMEEVKQRLEQPGTVLVDSRESRRYQGIEEPIDPVAGHIPGALNYFWKDSLTETGSWKSAEQQLKRFSDLRSDDEVIVYCGSGVTACPNILALKQAGFSNVRLYPGSWSDWCTYPANPIATQKD